MTDAGGPSNTTLTGIENGTAESVSAVTLRRLDAALRWPDGSARRCYEEGITPEPLGTATTTTEGNALASASDVALLAELARRLDRARGQGEDREPAPMTVHGVNNPDGTKDLSVSRSRKTPPVRPSP